MGHTPGWTPVTANDLRRSGRLLVLLPSLALLLTGGDAFANNGILIESTDPYSSCNIYPNLANDYANTEGLLSGMINWNVVANWHDANAWDRDFIDSDVRSNGDDYAAFDFASGSALVALSMFSGHGVCNDTSTQSCSSSSQCTSPGYGQSNPGSCTKGPNVSSGTCIYTAPRELLTCGSNDLFNHVVDYSDGDMALGESSNSGTWRGVGTNGGVNFAILDVSCGVRPGHELQGLGKAFAGVGNIATIMPTVATSDTSDSAMRGPKFAARWQANSNSSIAYSWASMINDMSSTDGGSCNGTTSGYRGIDGCGANFVASLAQNSTTAWWLNQTESWVDVQSDSHDTTASGWITWTYYCNYDCNTYPITL